MVNVCDGQSAQCAPTYLTQESKAAQHPGIKSPLQFGKLSQGSPFWGTQLPLTTPDHLPLDWQVTRGAPLLPAVKYGPHVALQLCPTAEFAHAKV
jgi:hypothetical protein